LPWRHTSRFPRFAARTDFLIQVTPGRLTQSPQQILEPFEEQRLRASIKRLTPITVAFPKKCAASTNESLPALVKISEEDDPVLQ